MDISTSFVDVDALRAWNGKKMMMITDVGDRAAGEAAARLTLETFAKSTIIGQRSGLKSGKIFVNNGFSSGCPS